MNKHNFDIRQYKKDLRERYKKVRTERKSASTTKKNEAIFRRICSMRQYRQAKTILCFVSTAIEVDTHRLISQALQDGKTVAVPYCVDGTRNMEFYRIQSLEELEARTFGVLEPVAKPQNKLNEFHDSICILPGLCFDREGYRLGYGGGYYDRFLSQVYTGTTIGICYSDCTRRSLIHGRYDVPCEWLVTEFSTRRARSAQDFAEPSAAM